MYSTHISPSYWDGDVKVLHLSVWKTHNSVSQTRLPGAVWVGLLPW